MFSGQKVSAWTDDKGESMASNTLLRALAYSAVAVLLLSSAVSWQPSLTLLLGVSEKGAALSTTYDFPVKGLEHKLKLPLNRQAFGHHFV